MAAAAIFLYGCAGVGEDKHQALELFVVSVVNVYMCCWCVRVHVLILFSQFCCSAHSFALLPTANSNLLQLPLFPEFTTHHWLLYLQLMCM